MDEPRFAGTIIAVATLAVAMHGMAMAQEALQPPAGQEIHDVLTAKQALSTTERKLSSDLVQQLTTPGAESLRSAAGAAAPPRQADILVDITGTITPALEGLVTDNGGAIVESAPEYNSLRARVPTSSLPEIAGSPDVRSVRSADVAETRKATITEGVRAHAVDAARDSFGVDGSGVSIGVMSDAIDQLGSLQATGELPDVFVLPGKAGAGGSEGTAMLEIITGMAPGAKLYFATANNGVASFARNIKDLANHGCRVIVDDVGYFREPVFEDGPIAQAVNEVAKAGVQYYSSAGNSGNLDQQTGGVWQGDFVPGPTPAILAGLGEVHMFQPGMVGNRITKDGSSVFSLQWSDPFGGSANDYDLFLLDAGMTRIVRSSTTVQDGNDDPYEQVAAGNGAFTNMVLVIVRKAGAQGRFLHLNTNGGQLAIATAGQTSGHAAALGAFDVAAVNVALANTGTFVGGPATVAERFSSDGPRRIFYGAGGVPVTPGNVSSTGGALRAKPDIAAADGVRTATPGFDPFFGTSAAAPHAAAIGALLLQSEPTLTPDAVRALYAANAVDIGAPGPDTVSGAGIIMADVMLQALHNSATAAVSTAVPEPAVGPKP